MKPGASSASTAAIASAADMRTCISCGRPKPVSEFSKHSGFSDGRRSTCKQCYNKAQKSDLYRFFRKIYVTQKASSAKRGHPTPDYSLDELIIWAHAQPQLPALWQAYQDTGHLRYLAPSFDRIDSNLPYSLGNLDLVTWGENDRRGTRDLKFGSKITKHKAVAAFNKDGPPHKAYQSLHQAARDVGGNPTNIQRVADGAIITKPDGRTTTLRSTKGFIWGWTQPVQYCGKYQGQADRPIPAILER